MAQHHKHTHFALHWNTLIWSENDWMSRLIYSPWKIAKQLILQVCVANSENWAISFGGIINAESCVVFFFLCSCSIIPHTKSLYEWKYDFSAVMFSLSHLLFLITDGDTKYISLRRPADNWVWQLLKALQAGRYIPWLILVSVMMLWSSAVVLSWLWKSFARPRLLLCYICYRVNHCFSWEWKMI